VLDQRLLDVSPSPSTTAPYRRVLANQAEKYGYTKIIFETSCRHRSKLANTVSSRRSDGQVSFWLASGVPSASAASHDHASRQQSWPVPWHRAVCFRGTAPALAVSRTGQTNAKFKGHDSSMASANYSEPGKANATVARASLTSLATLPVSSPALLNQRNRSLIHHTPQDNRRS
jgi:hypothetical protein